MIIHFIILLKLFQTKIIPINDRKYKWQIHSFNDPREIKQLLRKGSTLFKIDLYYVPQGLCNTNDLRCTQELRGCFDKIVNGIKDSINEQINQIDQDMGELGKQFRNNLFANSDLYCEIILINTIFI